MGRLVGDSNRRVGHAVLALLAAVGWLRVVVADPADVINGLRRGGCRDVAAAGSELRPDSALDAVARELANKRKLEAALARVAYPAAASTSFHIGGTRDEGHIRALLAESYCALVNDPRYTEVGFHRIGGDTWIVLAARSAQPFAALRDPAGVVQRVLDLVNDARAAPRECGRTQHDAAGPLTLSPVLTAAASLHSLDMVERGAASHAGLDGSAFGDRITRAGYAWRAAGENVAAGQDDAETVVAAWLESPGHCASLMNPSFTETGIAFALAPGKEPDVYWTQVFAAPR